MAMTSERSSSTMAPMQLPTASSTRQQAETLPTPWPVRPTPNASPPLI